MHSTISTVQHGRQVKSSWDCQYRKEEDGCKTGTLPTDWEKDPGLQNQEPEETSLHLLLGVQNQQLGAEQDQLLGGSTGTFFNNCQEMETCIIRARHAPHSLSKINFQGTLEAGWCCVWQRKCWIYNIKEWTSLPLSELLMRASHRREWKRISAELAPPPTTHPPSDPIS